MQLVCPFGQGLFHFIVVWMQIAFQMPYSFLSCLFKSFFYHGLSNPLPLSLRANEHGDFCCLFPRRVLHEISIANWVVVAEGDKDEISWLFIGIMSPAR